MFQLVLQLKPWGDRDFDQLVAFEDQLIDALDGTAEVDGHDSGSDEANIFIYCPDPLSILARCVAVAETAGLLPIVSAAHRPVDSERFPVDGERFTRVWPTNDSSHFEFK